MRFQRRVIPSEARDLAGRGSRIAEKIPHFVRDDTLVGLSV
jgi:hypothetical protein